MAAFSALPRTFKESWIRNENMRGLRKNADCRKANCPARFAQKNRRYRSQNNRHQPPPVSSQPPKNPGAHKRQRETHPRLRKLYQSRKSQKSTARKSFRSRQVIPNFYAAF